MGHGARPPGVQCSSATAPDPSVFQQLGDYHGGLRGRGVTSSNGGSEPGRAGAALSTAALIVLSIISMSVSSHPQEAKRAASEPQRDQAAVPAADMTEVPGPGRGHGFARWTLAPPYPFPHCGGGSSSEKDRARAALSVLSDPIPVSLSSTRPSPHAPSHPAGASFQTFYSARGRSRASEAPGERAHRHL